MRIVASSTTIFALLLQQLTTTSVNAFQQHQQVTSLRYASVLGGANQQQLKTKKPYDNVIAGRCRSVAFEKENDGDDWQSEGGNENETRATIIEDFLKEKFPLFYTKIMSQNDEIWKILAENDDGSVGCTIFAPTNDAISNLGDKKLQQLDDPRNAETVTKMASYHFIELEAVSYQRLKTEDWTKPKPKDGGPRPLTIGAVKTFGGELAVGRAKTGGFAFGLIGAKETGDPVIGSDNAKIVGSYTIPKTNCIIHEMDGLVSPQVLWRYCDQLRIPGT